MIDMLCMYVEKSLIFSFFKDKLLFLDDGIYLQYKRKGIFMLNDYLHKWQTYVALDHTARTLGRANMYIIHTHMKWSMQTPPFPTSPSSPDEV